MATYDELQKLIREGDTLADPDDTVTFDPLTGITIEAPPGHVDNKNDLRITIEGERLALRYRDGVGQAASPDGEFHGREWSQPVHFADYEDLNGFVYTMI